MLEKSEELEKLMKEYADINDNKEEIYHDSQNNYQKVEENLCSQDSNPNDDEGNNENKIFSIENNQNQNEEIKSSSQEEYQDEQIDNNINEEGNIPNSIQRQPKKSNNIKKELRKKYEDNIKKLFFKQSGNNNNENENIQATENNNEEVLGFSRLKKLKKKAAIIKEKEINKKVSFNQFFEVEAELGSDNEEHDDVIKKLEEDEIEEEEENAEEDLKDLINDIEEEYSEEDIHKKYFSDMLQRDREELKQVIEGPKRKILNKKRVRDIDNNLEEEDLPLNLRINNQNKVNQKDSQENEFNSLFKNFESFEKRLLSSEDNQDNEEFKDMLQLYQHNIIKKIEEKSKDHKSNLFKRIKENEKILENVINLNQLDKNSEKDKINQLFVQGNKLNGVNNSNPISQLNHLNSNAKINSTPNTGNLTGINSRMNQRSFLNSKNSFLHAMKNDKYYNKSNSEDISFISQNSAESNSNNSTASASSNSKSNSVPFFMKNSNAMISNNKSTNLSCLFTRSSKPRHNVEPAVKKLRTPNKNDGNMFNLKKLLN